jgi:hypothetical protein
MPIYVQLSLDLDVDLIGCSFGKQCFRVDMFCLNGRGELSCQQLACVRTIVFIGCFMGSEIWETAFKESDVFATHELCFVRRGITGIVIAGLCRQ